MIKENIISNNETMKNKNVDSKPINNSIIEQYSLYCSDNSKEMEKYTYKEPFFINICFGMHIIRVNVSQCILCNYPYHCLKEANCFAFNKTNIESNAREVDKTSYCKKELFYSYNPNKSKCYFDFYTGPTSLDVLLPLLWTVYFLLESQNKYFSTIDKLVKSLYISIPNSEFNSFSRTENKEHILEIC